MKITELYWANAEQDALLVIFEGGQQRVWPFPNAVTAEAQMIEAFEGEIQSHEAFQSVDRH